MWVSEVKTAKGVEPKFVKRETFDSIEEGRTWALDWIDKLIDPENKALRLREWRDEELVMEHRELKG